VSVVSGECAQRGEKEGSGERRLSENLRALGLAPTLKVYKSSKPTVLERWKRMGALSLLSRSLVSGLWSLVSGLWSLVSGLWSLVSSL
jgi:hypothetical protein